MAIAPLPMPAATLDRFQRLAATGAAVGLGLTVVLGFMAPASFFRGWLYAFLFWSGVALGCLSLTLIHNLTGGMWGLSIRRLLEAGTRTFPVLAAPVPAPGLRPQDALRVGRPAGRGRGQAAAAQGPLPERALLPGPRRLLLRGVGLPRAARQRLVAPAGRGIRPEARAQDTKPGRPGPRPPRLHPHLRLGGLGVVAQPPLVLHHLGGPLHGGPGALRPLPHGDAAGAAGRGRAPARGGAQGHGARPRQADAGLHHALGLPAPLPVPHHLVGQHRGGDALLPGPAPRGMEGGGLGAPALPLHGPLPAPPLAGPEAQRAQPGLARRRPLPSALRGSLLARGAGPRGPPRGRGPRGRLPRRLS